MPDIHPNTPRVAGQDAAPRAELIEAVLRPVEAGRLVALPSETAYLIATRADSPAALARLGAAAQSALATGSESEAPALLVRGPAALAGGFPLAGLARRLAARYWPGPLVLELEGLDSLAPALAREGRLRLRSVAHRATAGLVALAPMPLAALEAPGPGGALLVRADDVAAAHPTGIDLIVDGGPSRLGEASAVLGLGMGRFELCREGLLPLEQLRETAGLAIGFVCTGNTCRSPMAEGLARAELTRRLGSKRLGDFGFRVVSAGVHAAIGAPAAGHAIDVLAARSIDLRGHRARAAIPEEIARLDRVYCLTRAHVEALVMGLPPGRAGHVVLLDPDGRDVPDPVGGSKADYERCADALTTAIAQRADDWC